MPDAGFLVDMLGAVLPFECLQPRFMRQALLGLLLLAPITAAMGTQVVNLRMAFFSDAISHSVFAGVALGLLLSWDPHWSTLALAVMIGLGVTACQRRVNLSADSIIGVFFSGVVAFGLAAASRERRVVVSAQTFLYGDVLTLGDKEIWMLLAALVVVMTFQLFCHNRILYLGLNPSLAKVHGLGAGWCQYLFAALLSLTAVLAVWTVGVFLVTALLVLPASSARNLSRGAAGMFWWALVISLLSSVAGLVLSAQPGIATATGPTVVLTAFAFFILSLPFARRPGKNG